MEHRYKSPGLFIVLISGLLLQLSPRVSGFGREPVNTTFVREFAKHKTPVYIIVSGPQANEAGQLLQAEIQNSPDGGKQRVEVDLVTFEDAERIALEGGKDRKFGQAHHVFMIVRSEMKTSPSPALAVLMPFSIDQATGTDSLIQVKDASSSKHDSLFNAALDAPDPERLKRLLTAFDNRTSMNFKTLEFATDFKTNNVAVFSDPKDESAVENWGKLKGDAVWNSVQWHPLSDRDKLTADQLADASEVYFIDRSDPNPVVPAAVKPLLAAHASEITESTIFIGHEGDIASSQIAVVSVPDDGILQAKIRRYSTLATLDGAPMDEGAIDLRNVGPAPLLITGAASVADHKETIRSQLASSMHDPLKIDVEAPVEDLRAIEDEITLLRLQSSNAAAAAMRRKTGSRYFWMFQIVDLGGTTEYRAENTRITPEAPPFSEPEPTEPSTRKRPFGPKKDPEVYEDEMRQWRIAHAEWQRAKDDYDAQVNGADYEYRRTVTETTSARVHGTLSLIDLDHQDKVLWEHEGSSDDSHSGVYQSDSVSVPGSASRPDSLPTPPNSSDCPAELIQSVAIAAGRKAIYALQEVAIVPGSRLGKTVVETPQPVPPPVDVPDTVAALTGSIVTCSTAPTEAVRYGDKIAVLDTEPTGGAGSPKTKPVVLCYLRVVKVAAGRVNGAPIRTVDIANLGKVMVGMKIEWIKSPPRKPASPASLHRVARSSGRRR